MIDNVSLSLIGLCCVAVKGISRITDPAGRLANLALSKFLLAQSLDPFNERFAQGVSEVKNMLSHVKRRGGSFSHSVASVMLKDQLNSAVKQQSHAEGGRARGSSISLGISTTPSPVHGRTGSGSHSEEHVLSPAFTRQSSFSPLCRNRRFSYIAGRALTERDGSQPLPRRMHLSVDLCSVTRVPACARAEIGL